MGNRIRIRLILMKQLVIGMSYVFKTLYIGILCFNIQIDCSKNRMEFFKFSNLLNK